MKRLLSVLMALCLMSCSATAEEFDLSAEAQTIYVQLTTGDYASLTARFDDTMAA